MKTRVNPVSLQYFEIKVIHLITMLSGTSKYLFLGQIMFISVITSISRVLEKLKRVGSIQ